MDYFEEKRDNKFALTQNDRRRPDITNCAEKLTEKRPLVEENTTGDQQFVYRRKMRKKCTHAPHDSRNDEKVSCHKQIARQQSSRSITLTVKTIK